MIHQFIINSTWFQLFWCAEKHRIHKTKARVVITRLELTRLSVFNWFTAMKDGSYHYTMYHASCRISDKVPFLQPLNSKTASEVFHELLLLFLHTRPLLVTKPGVDWVQKSLSTLLLRYHQLIGRLVKESLTLIAPCGARLDPGGSFLCAAQKTISIIFLRFYDLVRLSIVISFQIMFSNSTREWHPYNQICGEVQTDPGK